MRIVGGQWRGKKLAVPEGKDTRPTLDRVRETVFNILDHNPALARSDGRSPVRDALVLDAFAGSGALGLEALSRGARKAVFFETGKAALAALKQNVAESKAGRATQVSAGSALKPVKATEPADLIFLDPPYGQGLVEQAVAALRAAGWIGPETLIYAECDGKERLELPGYELKLDRKIGRARVSLWSLSRL